jgi:hypothetical protein
VLPVKERLLSLKKLNSVFGRTQFSRKGRYGLLRHAGGTLAAEGTSLSDGCGNGQEGFFVNDQKAAKNYGMTTRKNLYAAQEMRMFTASCSPNYQIHLIFTAGESS